jgi:hypothetical protein
LSLHFMRQENASVRFFIHILLERSKGTKVSAL